MKIIRVAGKVVLFVTFTILFPDCVKNVETDPCVETSWPQSRELEIRLAVKVAPASQTLPSSTPGSEYPADFVKLAVSGTIEMEDCSDQNSGLSSIGNSYVIQGVDSPAPVAELEAYWVGSVVYVYTLSNDMDHLNVELTVKITMEDNQSYMTRMSGVFYPDEVSQVPMELYHYILLEISSSNWIKV